MPIANDTVLRRVRYQSSDSDTLSPRLRLNRDIAPADWRPPAMPRGAILCVRRMRTAGVPEDNAVRGKLEEALSIAVRPIEAPPPASATAVYFADYAELLACLALDSLRGRRDEWYWRDLLPDVPTSRHWVEVWVRHPIFCAAAVIRVLAMREAEEIFTALPAAAAATLEHTILRTFGAVEIWPDMEFAFTGTAPSARREDRTGAVPGQGLHPTESKKRPDPGWRVPERFRALPIAARLVVATAVQVAAEPRAARRPEFRTWLAALREVEETSERSSDPGLLSPLIGTQPVHEPLFRDGNFEAPPHSPNAPRAIVSELRQKEAHGVSPTVQVEAEDERETPPLVAPPPHFETTSIPIEPREQHRATATVRAQTMPVETEFAGAFFLLNAALRLGHYGDFTMPSYEGLALSPWRFLELLLDGAINDPLLALLNGWAGDDEFDRDQWKVWLATARVDLDRFLAEATAPFGPPMTIAEVCGQPGQIEFTEVEIHVSFALETHPLALRLSGLDRDPGWIPAAGRDIRFHFS